VALPDDVSTVVLVAGPHVDAAGAPLRAGARVTLRPVTGTGRPLHLVHLETGTEVLPAPVAAVADASGVAELPPVPHTDDPALRPLGFAYEVIVEDGGAVVARRRVAVPRDAGPRVVLGRLLGSVDAPGVYVPLAARVADVEAARDSAAAAQADAAAAATAAAHAASRALEAAGQAATAAAAATSADGDAAAARGAAADAVARAREAIDAADEARAIARQLAADPRWADRRAPLPGSVDDAAVAPGRLLLIPSERVKLDAVEAGATRNATDGWLTDRAHHTGTQSPATIGDLREFVEDTVGGMLGVAGVDLNITYEDRGGDAGALVIEYTGEDAEARAETMRDTLGAALIGVGNITVLPNDAGNTIVITTAATVNDTNAALRDRGTHTGTQSADTLTEGSTVRLLTQALYELLTGATDAATVGALVRRGPDGYSNLAGVRLSNDPAAGTHAARRSWVETYGALSPAAGGPLSSGSFTVLPEHLPSARTYTLGANLTVALGTGFPTGRAGIVTLVMRQPATGGPYTVTWPAALEWPNDAPAPVMPTPANAELIVQLLWTGGTWRASAAPYFP
jgi:hypothetical protein